MNKNYRRMRLSWGLLVALLGLLTSWQPAAAQSGPYGNEWINPSQQYYKIKVWRDGIYKIDYQYLANAGITNVDPSRIQLWRRGREVAIYQGGNPSVLDQNTYFEFFGQKNDAKLDADLYKNPAEQAHQFFSMYTDTSAYFLTYPVGGSSGQAGRRMATPVAQGSTPHGWRMQSVLMLENWDFVENPVGAGLLTQFPWLEAGEGFLSGDLGNALAPIAEPTDSALRAVPPAGVGPAPRLDLVVVGVTPRTHATSIKALVPGSGPARALGVLSYSNHDVVKARFPLLRSDIPSNGRFTIEVSVVNNMNVQTPPLPFRQRDLFRVGYFRVTAAQHNRWFRNRSHLYFQNDSLLGGPATYEVDTIPATVRGFDIHDPWNVQRVEPTAASTTGPQGRRFVFPSATGQEARRLLLYDLSRTMTPAPPRRVQFRNINPALPNYLIVTHKRLMGPATRANGTTVPNAARAYAEYRASTAGGRYDTLMVTSHQLYDQFHYGERSIMALRHFGLWMAANAAGQTKYLMLLGKGISPNETVLDRRTVPLPSRQRTRYAGESGVATWIINGATLQLPWDDLVPTSTRSVSDNFLTADFRNNDYVAKLPTGRVVARLAQEVVDYLDKVVAHESPTSASPALAAWRKNVLHLSGGLNPAEFVTFDQHLNDYKLKVERPCFNGQVVRTYSRTTIGSFTELPVNINISQELNAGLSLITYFGHGSPTVFALNLGNVNEPSNNYNNQGKYPVLFYNGCAAGALFSNTSTFGNNWLLAPGRGSIGLMGETGFGYEPWLHPSQDSMYARLFNNRSSYGKPIAQVYGTVVNSLQRQPFYMQSVEAVEQLLSTIWHGDPVLRMYSPELPDFQTNNMMLAVGPVAGQVLTPASSQLVLSVGVSNPGNFCTRTDSLVIRVTRTYGSPGRAAESFTFGRPLINQTNATYLLTLPNTGPGIVGSNRFEVTLDYGNREPELNENNNTAEVFYNFLQGGVTLLSPQEFAIVPTNAPRLVAQTNISTGQERGFEFELDTVPTFSSPLPLRQRTVLRAVLTPEWTPTLPANMSGSRQVWYWRVRLETPVAGEDANWVTSSFRVMPSLLGWSQSHYGQFRRDGREGVEVAAPAGRWSFTDELKTMELRTRGGGSTIAPTFNGIGGLGITANSLPALVGNCAVNTANVLVAVYDRLTLQPKTVPGTYLTCGQAPHPFYIFGVNPANAADTLNNINNSALRRGELQALLTGVADGDYVALVGMNRVRWASLPAGLKNAFASLLGSQLINSLQNGDPLALLAQKRSTGGSLIREVGPNLAAGAPPRNTQVVVLNETLHTPGIRGKVLSTRIGPAQQWETLSHLVVKETSTSSYNLRLIGVDSLGVKTQLLASVPTATTLSSYSLTGIAANQYPFLELELTLKDSLNRVPPQLKEWYVAYRGVPEGVVRRDLVAASEYEPARLATQATTGNGTIRFPVVFKNISLLAFGTPLKARLTLHENNNGSPGVPVAGLASAEFTDSRPLAPNDTVVFNVSLDVRGRFGTFIPVVTVNPPGTAALPEQNYFNNQLVLAPFTVVDNNLPPTLDVAFDGRHILNGELVSPNPTIVVQMNDDDQVRHIDNRSFFTVTLERPGQPATLVDLNGTDIDFAVETSNGSVAKLTYQPGKNTPLADGMYTLRVQGRDASQTNAGTEDYQIKFEVINKSMVSNVFPYPNPVTSKARFVFTVTGQELPQNMKIQIMTIAGRVVKEIFMGDLGPLHIGNNVTEYAWDGTDQYGDRLANGTYLYRVMLDDAAGKFSKYGNTTADRAMKNDWGKLVLMR